MKLFDLAQQIIKQQVTTQWFVTNVNNKVHYFFHTRTTKTGRYSGVFITLKTDENGTRIYSKTRNFNTDSLVSLSDYLPSSNIDEAVDFLQNVLNVCIKNGQKITK